jgi:hypothetical protein
MPLPIKALDSPMFGKDIIMIDQPIQAQYKIALCSNFNQWLYTAMEYKGSMWGSFREVTEYANHETIITSILYNSLSEKPNKFI